MKTIRKLTAYDRGTERLVFDIDLLDHDLVVLRQIEPPPMVGALPVSRDLVRSIASRLEIAPTAVDECDWFVEPFASEEAFSEPH